MPREYFKNGDFVTKGQEAGVVIRRRSHRTGKTYLTVSISKGPRRGQLEFPEKGWSVDMGDVGGNERPSHEPEDYVGSEEWKTRHHSR